MKMLVRCSTAKPGSLTGMEKSFFTILCSKWQAIKREVILNDILSF